MSQPSNRTVPLSGWVKPARQANSVVLPAPLGPMRATISCLPTSNVASSSALSPPKDLQRPRTSSTTASPTARPKQPHQSIGQPRHDGNKQAAIDGDAEGLRVAEPRQHAADIARQLSDQVQHARADEGAEHGAGPAKQADEQHFHRLVDA